MSARRSGRTLYLMQACPENAVFVWCNQYLEYPKELAKFAGREDLKIVPPSWLSGCAHRGQYFTDVVLDHETHYRLDEEQERNLYNIRLYQIKEKS